MGSSLAICLVFMMFPLSPVLSCLSDQCRELAFPSSLFFGGGRLINHVIASGGVMDKDFCELQCYLEHNCVSINFEIKLSASGFHNCELNNSTHKEHEKDLVKAADYVYHGTTNACGKAPCKNNATCQSGFTSKGYRCLCTPGFTGKDCQHGINDCSNVPRTTGIYSIWNHGSEPFPVYCEQEADGGGWTMVFKVIGGVASHTIDDLWSSSETLAENVDAALDTTTTYRGHYKNRIVLNWQKFNPQQARVVLYNRSTEIASLKFRASGTNNTNWFSQNNLEQSPWTDLKTATKLRAFSIHGAARTFEISKPYGTCNSDAGWFLLTQLQGSICHWENRLPKSSILYSNLTNAVTWKNYDYVGVADVMIVYIR